MSDEDDCTDVQNNLNELEARALLDEIVETKNIKTWTKEQETLISQWADKCQLYKKMHALSGERYNTLNSVYSYPVVILSSVIGISGFAIIKMEKPTVHEIILQYIFSSGNVIIGVLSSLSKFQNCSEKSDQHRNASMCYSKIYRQIRMELSIDRKYRKNAIAFTKDLKGEFDSLSEISMMIPQDIRKRCDKMKPVDDNMFCDIRISSAPESC
jgi:hypothetical protein